MDTYEMVDCRKRNLSKICGDIALKNFSISDVIVIPRLRNLQIFLNSYKNLDDDLKHRIEDFFSQNYSDTVVAKIQYTLTEKPKTEKKFVQVKTTENIKSVPAKTTGNTKSVPAKTTENTKSVPAKITNNTKSVPAKTTNDTKSVPAKTTENTKSVPAKTADNKISVPAKTADDKISVPAKTANDKKTLKINSFVAQKIKGNVMTISNLKDGDKKIIIEGVIGADIEKVTYGYDVTLRELKKDSYLLSFCVIDSTDGIVCKHFFRNNQKETALELKEFLKAGMRVKVFGNVKHDDYLKENVLMFEKIEPLEKEPARTDNAEVKRTELHVHTTMSQMDAVISPETLIETAANWGWSSVAITDHGVIQAFPKAAETAHKLSKSGKPIKIIYGMEGYVVNDPEQKFANHIILLAKNKIGLENLYRLVSISQLKYMKYTPRIPKNLLKNFREGLIIGSACEAGELIRAIVEGKTEAEIEEIANFYDYLEIQPYHNNDFLVRSEEFPNIKTDEDLIDINKKVAALAQKLNKPLVATCDAHFLNKDDGIYRAIMMTGKGFKDAKIQPPLYLRTTDEMLKEFDYLDSATAYAAVVTNPNKIAESVEFLKPIPDNLYSPAMSGADEKITNMTYSKARRLYGENLPKIVEDRLQQELKPIINHGFSSLYLIAQLLVKKSNDDGYLVGSRGSVGSSFVATMTGITEVNPLQPHYRCPKCQYSKFFTDGSISSGYDLPDKNCPVCGYPLAKDGHDIPFAVFLGFDGDKVPDIDLNFSGEYQATAHKYTEILFGRHNVYRAGSIMTIAEKTAFVYTKKYFAEQNQKKHGSYIAKISEGCVGVKTTSGQHPAGIMVVPRDMDIHYFSPIQHPAGKKNPDTITTHFDYHSISSRLVKLDILGHDDPTIIKMLENLIHIDYANIPLDDKATLSIFNSTDAINVTPEQIGTNSATFGIPEFRTTFTRMMIDDTHPDCFSDLVRISGFSHGTDVWIGNAQDLIKNNICTLKQAISGREDMLRYFINLGVDDLKSFKIMEKVRKGKGLSPDEVEILKSHNVPDWYIESCQKIKYLFPRAHATAYVMMAYRIAYCKVHYPLAYYCAYFSIRASEFDAQEISKGKNHIKDKMDELTKLSAERKLELLEEGTLAVMQLAYEMILRGFTFERVDLYKSDAEKFIMLKNSLLPPLQSLTGVGPTAAINIVKARESGEFSSIEDLRIRAGINKTSIAALQEHGCLNGLSESNQTNLFEV